MKNSITEVDAIVWTFQDRDQGMDLLLVLNLLINRVQRRTWSEIWGLYQILELQSAITPGTLEYLLQLEGGDAMKLKDVMLCDYSEVKEILLTDEKDLDACYRMLQKLRKEEDQLAKDDATGISDTVENAGEITSDNTSDQGQLTDQDVYELLEMVDSLDSSIDEDDFDSLNSIDDADVVAQEVGKRHPLDSDLRMAVLDRDNFSCQCCGVGGSALLGILAVHHILPVHVGGKDELKNLTTLCLNHHIVLHIAERNGGKLQMTKEVFDAMKPAEQEAIKKTLKLAKIAVEAAKRKGMTKENIREGTKGSLRHPMPGEGLKENQEAYKKSRG